MINSIIVRNSMPQISVIVPVYNVEKYINRCVDSILNQTFSDFELILVDDGSPDNCGAICDEYALKDNRIHVIHKENGGLSDARNAGIDWAFEKSDSEWVTFIDSDDWVHPKYLEALFDAVIVSGCSISICGFSETTGVETTAGENIIEYELTDTESFFCNHNVNAVIACGKLYKKSLFTNIRYPVGKLHEDEFTTYKVLFKTKKCVFINQPLYFYYYNPESITKSGWNPKRMDVIEAIFQNIQFFEAHGYVNACVHQIKNQGKNIWFHYITTQKQNINNYSYVRYLKKSMRKLLIVSKHYHVLSKKRYPEYYRFAFTCQYKIYLKVRKIKSKLTEIIN